MVVFVTLRDDAVKTPLAQRAWSDLLNHMDVYYLKYGRTRFGIWYSAPDNPMRAATWNFEPYSHMVEELKEKLETLAERYWVSVTWTESLRQELFTVGEEEPILEVMTSEPVVVSYDLDLRAERYYRGLNPEQPNHERISSAISDAITRIDEWSYESDAHGYCHDRTDWIALVIEISRLRGSLNSGGNNAAGQQEEDSHVQEQDSAGDSARRHPGAGVVDLGTRERGAE